MAMLNLNRPFATVAPAIAADEYLRFSGSYGSPACGTSTLAMVTTASRLSDSIAS